MEAEAEHVNHLLDLFQLTVKKGSSVDWLKLYGQVRGHGVVMGNGFLLHTFTQRAECSRFFHKVGHGQGNRSAHSAMPMPTPA